MRDHPSPSPLYVIWGVCGAFYHILTHETRLRRRNSYRRMMSYIKVSFQNSLQGSQSKYSGREKLLPSELAQVELQECKVKDGMRSARIQREQALLYAVKRRNSYMKRGPRVQIKESHSRDEHVKEDDIITILLPAYSKPTEK